MERVTATPERADVVLLDLATLKAPCSCSHPACLSNKLGSSADWANALECRKRGVRRLGDTGGSESCCAADACPCNAKRR